MQVPRQLSQRGGALLVAFEIGGEDLCKLFVGGLGSLRFKNSHRFLQ